jgi:hypothetical protein
MAFAIGAVVQKAHNEQGPSGSPGLLLVLAATNLQFLV